MFLRDNIGVSNYNVKFIVLIKYIHLFGYSNSVLIFKRIPFMSSS